jgi:hypothetical protein
MTTVLGKNWRTDPGYRGMPLTSTKDLTRPGAGSNPTTHVNESKGLNPS